MSRFHPNYPKIRIAIFGLISQDHDLSTTSGWRQEIYSPLSGFLDPISLKITDIIAEKQLINFPAIRQQHSTADAFVVAFSVVSQKFPRRRQIASACLPFKIPSPLSKLSTRSCRTSLVRTPMYAHPLRRGCPSLNSPRVSVWKYLWKCGDNSGTSLSCQDMGFTWLKSPWTLALIWDFDSWLLWCWRNTWNRPGHPVMRHKRASRRKRWSRASCRMVFVIPIAR